MNVATTELRKASHRRRSAVGTRTLRTLAVIVALGGYVHGCGGAAEDEAEASGHAPGWTPGKAKPAVAATTPGTPKAADNSKSAELVPLVLKDEDFTESPRNRDPFRSNSTSFRAKAPEEMQRRVVMPTTSVDEMRLIAIVTGMPQPKAMLVDPAGVGYVVQRGDYVGRPKVIQATGSVSMALNWRVDRIRENEVVLTQQDPAEPTRSALTKIIPLRDEVAQR
jgi:type IV pilus assembly protein PilP